MVKNESHLRQTKVLENLERAFEIAEDKMGIPMLIDPHDMVLKFVCQSGLTSSRLLKIPTHDLMNSALLHISLIFQEPLKKRLTGWQRKI